MTEQRLMSPRWLDVAQRELGVMEKPGKANEARILEYHATTTLKARADSVPWCSAWVNWVLLQCKIKGTDSAAARSWLKWGVPLEVPMEGEREHVGAIVVFQRGSSSWQGHVGFFLGTEGRYVLCLGGNQKDRVKVSKYPRTKVLGYRWPKGEGTYPYDPDWTAWWTR